MAAMAEPRPVIRIKRRRSQDPAEALEVTLAKRTKEDVVDGEDEAALVDKAKAKPAKVRLLLAATLATEEVSDSKSVARAVSAALKSRRERTTSSVKERAREQLSKARVKQRERILKDMRDLSSDEKDEDPEETFKMYDMGLETDKHFKLFEVKENGEETRELIVMNKGPEAITCNGVKLKRQATSNAEEDDETEEVDYVYDLYLASVPKAGSAGSDQAVASDWVASYFECPRVIDSSGISLDEFCDDLKLDEYRELGFDEDHDSEDSNAEDNWRNDYPDEEAYGQLAYDSSEERSSEDFGMDNLNLSDSDEGKPEDGDDPLVFSRTYKTDKSLHGASYARFKQRVLKQFKEDEDDGDESDINEVDDYY